MDSEHINLLIEKKIAEAKIDSIEKSFSNYKWYFSAFLVVFGVILPLYLIYDSGKNSKDRVDTAIKSMEKDFEDLKTKQLEFTNSLNSHFKDFAVEQKYAAEKNNNVLRQSIKDMQAEFRRLAELQLRKPEIKCMNGGRPLEGSIIKLGSDEDVANIEIRNVGEGPTRNIRIKLYTKTTVSYGIYTDGPLDWEKIEVNDEPHFDFAYLVLNNSQLIYPKESQAISFKMNVSAAGKETIPAMLKVYYEQSEPVIFNFTLVLDNKN